MKNKLIVAVALLAITLNASCTKQRQQALAQSQAIPAATPHKPAKPHEPAKPRQVYLCGAMTKKGTPCKNHVKAEGQHCHLHGDNNGDE